MALHLTLNANNILTIRMLFAFLLLLAALLPPCLYHSELMQEDCHDAYRADIPHAE